MSATVDLLTGIAQTLNDAGVATYSQSTAYAAGDTGVYLSLMPPDGRCVVLSAYKVGAEAQEPMDQDRVQVRFRGVAGDPLDVLNLRDAVQAVLHGLTHQTFGSTTAIQLLLLSSIPLGQDENLRYLHADNYGVDSDVPATATRFYR